MHYLELIKKLHDHGEIINIKGKEVKELINQELTISTYNFVCNELSRPFDKVYDYLRIRPISMICSGL